MLEVRDLRIYFKTDSRVTKAVDGIDFAVYQDEVLGLVGESGCGKTVTALSIMKLLPPQVTHASGSVLFENSDIFKMSESDILKIRGSKIGLVPQEPFTSLNPVIRIGEQVQEALLAHKSMDKPAARDLALELLEKTRLDDPKRVFYDYPHRLSGGERQRVLIAMALALKPKLLIADEPTTALDVTIQKEILNLILDLKKEMKMSVLFITHDFGLINELADRVVVMKDGKVVERGKKDEILKFPQRDYTKKLIKAVPRLGQITEAPKEPSKETFIETKLLSKSFPVHRGVFRKEVSRIEAVKDVSLKIEKGKTLGLVGESGSGKTTYGRMLLKLIEPDKGEILLNDKPLDDLLDKSPKEVRKMLQIVFQDPYSSLDPRMRIEDIILEGPRILGIGKNERKAILEDVLRKVHLDFNARFKYPHQFSGGQRQRIAIARALAVRPTFLVLDEPVSSLDVLIQAEILNLLKVLQNEFGLTYLFISHDLRVVEFMSDDVAVMYKGRIVEVASRNRLYRNPTHQYTKKLLASIPGDVSYF